MLRKKIKTFKPELMFRCDHDQDNGGKGEEGKKGNRIRRQRLRPAPANRRRKIVDQYAAVDVRNSILPTNLFATLSTRTPGPADSGLRSGKK